MTADASKPTHDHTPPAGWLTGIRILDSVFIECGKDLVSYQSGAVSIAHLDGGELAGLTIVESLGAGIRGGETGGWLKGTRIHDNSVSILGTGKRAIFLRHVSEGVEVSANTVNHRIDIISDGEKLGGARTVLVHDNIVDLAGRAGVPAVQPQFLGRGVLRELRPGSG